VNILKFLRFTGNAAVQIAPVVVSVISPALGPIAAAVANQVITAEAVLGAGKGPEKKSRVLEALPIMIPLVEGLIGRDVVKDEAFTAAIGQLIDAVVAVMNSLNAEPPATTVQVAAVPQPGK
jgi:hypothetical protein